MFKTILAVGSVECFQAIFDERDPHFSFGAEKKTDVNRDLHKLL
jgi:hypothetical protein